MDDARFDHDSGDEDTEVEESNILQILFNLPDQTIVESYTCAIVHKIVWHGRLYLSKEYLAFFSNVFGIETKRVIHLSHLLQVRKTTRYLIAPELEVITSVGDSPVIFANFFLTGRDQCFNECTALLEAFKRDSIEGASGSGTPRTPRPPRGGVRDRRAGASSGSATPGAAPPSPRAPANTSEGGGGEESARSARPRLSSSSSGSPASLTQASPPALAPSPRSPPPQESNPPTSPAGGALTPNPQRSLSLQPMSRQRGSLGSAAGAPAATSIGGGGGGGAAAAAAAAAAAVAAASAAAAGALSYTAAPATSLLREAPSALWSRLAKAKVLVDLTIPCTIEEYAFLCLGDRAVCSHESFHVARGDLNFRAEPWRCTDSDGSSGGGGGPAEAEGTLGRDGGTSVPTSAAARRAAAAQSSASASGGGGLGHSRSVSMLSVPTEALKDAAAASSPPPSAPMASSRLPPEAHSLLDGLLRIRQLSYTMLLRNPMFKPETVVTKFQRAQYHSIAAAQGARGGGGEGGAAGGEAGVLVLDSYNKSSSTPYCECFDTEETWVVCSAGTSIPLAAASQSSAAAVAAAGSVGCTRLVMACKLAWSKTPFVQSIITAQVESALKALGEDYVRSVTAFLVDARKRVRGGSLIEPRNSLLLLNTQQAGGGARAAGAAGAGAAAAANSAAAVSSAAAAGPPADPSEWPPEARALVASLRERIQQLEGGEGAGGGEGGGGGGVGRAGAAQDAKPPSTLIGLSIGEVVALIASLPVWMLLLALVVRHALLWAQQWIKDR
jgi:hypothetical protein